MSRLFLSTTRSHLMRPPIIRTSIQSYSNNSSQNQNASPEMSGVHAVIVDSKIPGVETKLQGLETKLVRIESRLVGIEYKLAGVRTDLAGIGTDLAGVRNELAGIRAKVFGLKPKLEDHKTATQPRSEGILAYSSRFHSSYRLPTRKGLQSVRCRGRRDRKRPTEVVNNDKKIVNG
ncbi:hypothetical protein B0T24DRAFT_669992 [Lasiosphaeria ovina]|uniref:Uncharacterized protein n=1 Tax=Lasiosphaeria ovina TaxID=92902 RepID=A0AAE0JWN4_9PEZI|nr:hypothetical protein B0T24DRAFT_669992 [Lasiosphaeria ovina]